MGYRSDVYICIRGPAERMLAEVATLRLAGDSTMHEALDEWTLTSCEDEENRAVLVLGGLGTDWKWYDSYPDVQAHMKIYEHFETLEYESAMLPDVGGSVLDGIFVRVGEDDDDVERRSFGDSSYDLGGARTVIEREFSGSGTDLRPRVEEAHQRELDKATGRAVVHNPTSLDDMKKTL